MGILDLISNTVEGVLETTINTAKTAVGVVVIPFDDGHTLESGIDGIEKGVSKIGNSEPATSTTSQKPGPQASLDPQTDSDQSSQRPPA